MGLNRIDMIETRYVIKLSVIAFILLALTDIAMAAI